MASETNLVILGIWDALAKETIISAAPNVAGLIGGTNTQAAGTVVGTGINIFATVAASTAAVLPAGTGAAVLYILNNGANALNVFPNVGGNINGLANNAVLTAAVPAGKIAEFITQDGVTWLALVSAL